MCKGEVACSLFVEASIRLVQVKRRIILPEVFGSLENHDLIMCFGARGGAVG
jgi:hypothetical protein